MKYGPDSLNTPCIRMTNQEHWSHRMRYNGMSKHSRFKQRVSNLSESEINGEVVVDHRNFVFAQLHVKLYVVRTLQV